MDPLHKSMYLESVLHMYMPNAKCLDSAIPYWISSWLCVHVTECYRYCECIHVYIYVYILVILMRVLVVNSIKRHELALMPLPGGLMLKVQDLQLWEISTCCKGPTYTQIWYSMMWYHIVMILLYNTVYIIYTFMAKDTLNCYKHSTDEPTTKASSGWGASWHVTRCKYTGNASITYLYLCSNDSNH